MWGQLWDVGSIGGANIFYPNIAFYRIKKVYSYFIISVDFIIIEDTQINGYGENGGRIRGVSLNFLFSINHATDFLIYGINVPVTE